MMDEWKAECIHMFEQGPNTYGNKFKLTTFEPKKVADLILIAWMNLTEVSDLLIFLMMMPYN